MGISATTNPLQVSPDSLGCLVKKTIFSSSLAGVLYGFRTLFVSLFDRAFAAVICVVCIYGVRPFCRVTVRGLENVQKEGRVLYLIRHRSSFAPFLIECRIMFPWILWNTEMWPINVGKEKHLGKLPRFLQQYLQHIGVVFLPERSEVTAARRREIVDTEVAAFEGRKHRLMFLFPTGTRDDPAEQTLRPFMWGVGKTVAEARPNIAFIWPRLVFFGFFFWAWSLS